MKAPPAFFRGAYRSAVRVALQEIVSGTELDNPTRITRGWKLFTLHPRLLLTKPPRGGKVPKNKLLERVQKFASGEWLDLLRLSLEASEAASQLRSRRRRTQHDTVTKRVERAEFLVCLGEISAARHALEGSPVAPGTEETLNALRDMDRRPPLPRDPIPEEIRAANPSNPLELDKGEFLHNLRTARRGAAGGPSGMRNEHLRPLLDNAEDCTKFFEISQAFAQAKLPEEIVSALRMGQMTALQKANGGIRGVVVGDVIRRLVAKTLAKQFMTRFEDATKTFQYALSTRAGCESIAHVVQVMTDRDPNCTVLSIDGVGAFDLVSRRAMMTAVHSMDQGEKLIPFLLQFYGHPSTHVWEDEEGTVQQGEGGEQGDPLMPALFAMGQHQALQAVQESLQPTEDVDGFPR